MSSALEPPVVSVAMPVHNGGPFLAPAIESILAQTLGDFELHIVDNASEDGSGDVAHTYARMDDRIDVVTLSRKVDTNRSHNAAMKAGTGEFVALAHADDLSEPDRLEAQVAYMRERPEVGLCGSEMTYFTDEGEQAFTCLLEPPDVAIRMLFLPSLFLPSYFGRRAALTAHDLWMDPRYELGGDYDLILRCAQTFPIGNVGRRLVRYRGHPEQWSKKGRETMNSDLDVIRRAALERSFGPLLADEAVLLYHLIRFDPLPSTLVEPFRAWLQRLAGVNALSGRLPIPVLSGVLAETWDLMRMASGLPFPALVE